MGDWQDISTAPKDGTRILITFPRAYGAKHTWGTVRIAKWDSHHEHWLMDMSSNFRTTTEVSHWMPLPDPPRSP